MTILNIIRLNTLGLRTITLGIFLISGLTLLPASAQQNSTAGVKTPSGLEKPQTKSTLDEADLFWMTKRKYFLVVAASKTSGTVNNLPFTKVDAQGVSKALTERGYEKLDVLDDKRATRDNFIKQLKTIRSLPDTGLVLVYYSGHAVKDPQEKDLWLQLYGQTEFGDHFGVSLSELIGAARGNTYKGDLVIVLDTCYSGQSTLSGQLSLRETEKTVIFASSTAYQESYSIKLPSGEISAFTHFLLQGLGSDWGEVDGDGDGIIFYNDLQAYIENKLLESRQNEAILGTMQPQLFGQSSKIWAAYDQNQVHNRDTQARRNLRLERTFQLQDPEKLTELLRKSFPADAHSYLKALKAIDDNKFAEASELLDAAEKEGRVPLAEIYWARANLKTEQGQLSSARDWFEKALAISPQRNVDLIAYAAGTNFAVGNWSRAAELFKQVLELSSDRNSEAVFGALFSLTMVNVLQGNTAEADVFLRQLKELDPKVLGEDEDDIRVLVPFLEVLSDLIQEKPEQAKSKIDELQKAIAKSDAETRAAFQSFLQMIDPLLNPTESDPKPFVLSATQIKQWAETLKAKKVNALVFLLNQLQAFALSSNAGALQSPEVESLLKQTVDFARELKFEKQYVEIHDSSGVVRKVPIEGSEDQSSAESASLLTVAAMFYSARKETAEAEKLFKEAIALDEQEHSGAVLAINAIMRLGELYQASGRMAEAETLYKNSLIDLREPLGDQNIFAYILNQRLGALYGEWKRFPESERSYRTALQVAISTFGSEGFMAVDARETLATFLTEQNRLVEAIQLLEETVALLNQKTASGSLMNADSLGKDYFALAQNYYNLGRYELAEKTLKKVSDIYSSKKKPDLIEDLSCLHWQWVTALALKKQADVDSFYGRMVQIVESNIANPKPNESLGAELQGVASWFRNAGEYSKADQLLRLAMLVQEKRYGSERPEIAQVHESLADLYEAERQYGNAIASLKKAEGIYANQTPKDQVRIASVVYRQGFDYYQRQDFDQALEFLQRSSDLVDQIPLNQRTDYFSKYQFPKYSLARVERMSGHYDSAIKLINAVLDIDQVAVPREDSYIVSDFLELGVISRLKGNVVEAEGWLARAEKILEKVPAGKLIGRRAKLAHEKGMLDLLSGQVKRAVTLLREAVEKGQTDPEMDQVSLAEFLDDYAKVLHQSGKDKEGNQAEQRAKQIRDLLRNGR